MKTKLKFILGVAAIVLATVLFTPGCSTTAQRISYQTAGATSISVETALAGYNQFAKAGKTTVAQNAAVKAAYLKYQSAMAVLCDAGAIYAAGNTTNAPAAAALQQATLNASASIADVLTLVSSLTATATK